MFEVVDVGVGREVGVGGAYLIGGAPLWHMHTALLCAHIMVHGKLVHEYLVTYVVTLRGRSSTNKYVSN